MPAHKNKTHKPSEDAGVPGGANQPQDTTDTPAPAKKAAKTATKSATGSGATAKTVAEPKATADTTPAMSTPNGKATKKAGPKAEPKAEADATAEPAADADPDEEQPPANPLEALRRAQAKRVAPPGTQPRFGGSGTRGGNPSAPRHYNRHK